MDRKNKREFMNDLVEAKIQNMIYEIRGKQVMLDS